MKITPVCIIPHAHWDRDWYFPFQVFRGRFLHLMEIVSDLLEEFPEFKFYLDGQTIAIEDYLEVFPQKREELFSKIREKRVLVGPFYVLPDEFLISGETFIRNFLVAQRFLNENSLPSMKVAYFPDMFGHSAYIPTLIKGLGMKTIALWRGVGDKCRDAEFIWEGPDGSEVLTINIIDGYANFLCPPKEYGEFKKFLEEKVKKFIEHSKSGHILLMYGADRSFPSRTVIEFVKKLKEEGYNIKIGSLDEHAEALLRLNLKLRKIKGELRDPKYEPILKDVASSRMHLKQKSHLIEHALIRVVEPLIATAYLLDIPVDTELNLLHYAWKLFLKTTPHDDICGCGSDQVHREMEVLQDQVLQLIQVIKCELMNKLMEKFRSQSKDQDKHYLIVFSPFARDTKTIIEKEIYLPPEEPHEDLVVIENGKKLPTFVEYLEETTCIIKNDRSFEHFNTAEEDYLREFLITSEIAPPQNVRKKRIKIRFEAKLPPIGVKVFEITHGREKSTNTNVPVKLPIETPFLKVNINTDGTLNVEDKRTGRRYKNLCYFEDWEDIGDEYNYCPSKNPEKISTLGKHARIKTVAENDLGFLIEVEHNLEIPEYFDFENEKRATKRVSLPVKVSYFIHKTSPRIDVKIHFKNSAKDHRFRAHFELSAISDFHISDDYFGPIKRANKIESSGNIEEYVELPENRYPMQNFVYVADENGGMVISTKGLREYEVEKSESAINLALTLLRSVGMLSRPNLVTRKGNAGPEVLTPGAQSLGSHTAEFSLYFTERYSLEEAYNFSEAYQGLPVAYLAKDIEKTNFSMVKINPSSLILSAFKVAEDGNGVILRFYNIADSEVTGSIRLGWIPNKVETANLAENSIETPVNIEKNEIRIKAKPHEVITIKLS